ncbi:MAG: hypothetical protein ACYCQJ_06620 [Nitrososphaerales archaeon]
MQDNSSHENKERYVLIPLENSTGLGAPVIFLTLSAFGLILHFAAILLTEEITVFGIGAEGNPLYHVFGQEGFISFGFLVLVGYYCLLWISSISIKYKIMGASFLTGITFFDFLHDLLFLAGMHSWLVVPR